MATKEQDELNDLLALVTQYRFDAERATERGGSDALVQRALRRVYAQIRERCAKHGLHLPNDIPDEDETQ